MSEKKNKKHAGPVPVCSGFRIGSGI